MSNAASNETLLRQRRLKEERSKQDASWDDEGDEHLGFSSTIAGADDVTEAIFVLDEHLQQSPAHHARELMAKFLPAPLGKIGAGESTAAVVDTHIQYQIPMDQYHDVLLAVDPL